MKKFMLLIAIFAFGFNCLAQNTPAPKPVYDAALAKKLGADKYGMKKYVMAFLKDGPTRLQDSTARMQLQMAHLKNISRLAAEGKLVVAGPSWMINP